MDVGRHPICTADSLNEALSNAKPGQSARSELFRSFPRYGGAGLVMMAIYAQLYLNCERGAEIILCHGPVEGRVTPDIFEEHSSPYCDAKGPDPLEGKAVHCPTHCAALVVVAGVQPHSDDSAPIQCMYARWSR